MLDRRTFTLAGKVDAIVRKSIRFLKTGVHVMIVNLFPNPARTPEGLHGLIGLKSMSKALKEKIAADFKEAAADGSIGARLGATGSVINGMFGLLIIANSAIGIIQEYRAARTLAKLAVLGEARPVVRRDGVPMKNK